MYIYIEINKNNYLIILYGSMYMWISLCEGGKGRKVKGYSMEAFYKMISDKKNYIPYYVYINKILLRLIQNYI